ncbi:MAG: DNA translocase FtsK [Mogibacterium sp.]|nr:DNA translocase FtsK [Mogibacterium sp.]
MIISIFMVANSPISRLAGKIGKKREENRILKELEADERRRLSEGQIKEALTGDPMVSAAAPEPKQPFWRSVLSGIIREEPAESQVSAYGVSTDIPQPFNGASMADSVKNGVQVMDPPAKKQEGRGTLFGKLMDRFAAGIDSETGEKLSQDNLKTIDDPGPLGKGAETSSSKSIYSEDRHFDSDDVENFGYPGRKRSSSSKSSTGLGLGDPDDVGHSGSFGLDAHGGAKKAASASGKAAVAASTAAAAATKKSSSATKKPVEKEADSEDAKISAGFNTMTDDFAYELPPVSLLRKDTSSKQMMSDAQLQERAELLESTLKNFGVDAKVIKVTQGASVTRYEVQPATGVKVASITRLSDDIALNMRAKSIRMEAPIPGKAAVGIEVENEKPAPVLIRDLIDSDEFMDASSIIEFVVGKDISGNNIVADLREMPHLLIAGATGSGKSVCINSIITSFLYKARPSELKLIMIDPKMVELGNYNGIPHMLTPVVTDPRKAARALAIAVAEMEKRYELFAENNVKDLESYNELMRVDQRYADCKPQIVIIIDELADLMMASPSEVENSICRLAQKARAAGMHLIVATQRPSVDVVTGLIKANIPSRIAFSVASQFDSRTIIDMAGAEKLLGKGDMLFSPVGSTKPYRVQGPFISEKETDKIIRFVKKEGGNPEYDEELMNGMDNTDKKVGGESQDELTEDAIAFIFKSKQASVSMLQRRFRIGYNRAARIIDEIEEMGIIGPSDGSRPRQLLMTEEEYYGGGDPEPEPEPIPEPVYEPEPVNEPEPEPVYEPDPEPADEPEPEPEPEYVPVEEVMPEPEMAPEDDGFRSNDKLSNTRAMDSFNSLPESVKRMIMDADSESDY